MQVLIVESGSRLLEPLAKCRACPNPIKVGQSVLWARIDSPGDNRFVVHTECAAALVDLAPVGRPVLSVKARYVALRRAAREREAAAKAG